MKSKEPIFILCCATLESRCDMNPRELMIGDWYAFRGHPYKCTASDIASLAECEEKGVPTDISEIPLTPEILEKNGAKHSVYERPYFDYEPTEEELNDALQYYPFHGYNLGTNIQVAFYPKEIRVEVFGEDFVDMFKIRGRKGDVYVHELQHALRLCGIEKEITI